MSKQITEIPDAIMINVPNIWFEEKGYDIIEACKKQNHEWWKLFPNKNMVDIGMDSFKKYYESMGTEGHEELSFYHFISCVPIHASKVISIYVCFGGFVQYKAIIVQFIKQSNCADIGFRNYPVRDWVVTTGPVVKAPEGVVQKGFRGFRYTKHLF